MHRRTSIYLDDSAMKALKLLAVASGTTVSEKIREAVDVMLTAQVGQVDWPAQIEAILDRAGARKLPDMTGEELQDEVEAVRRARSAGEKKPRSGA